MSDSVFVTKMWFDSYKGTLTAYSQVFRDRPAAELSAKRKTLQFWRTFKFSSFSHSALLRVNATAATVIMEDLGVFERIKSSKDEIEQCLKVIRDKNAPTMLDDLKAELKKHEKELYGVSLYRTLQGANGFCPPKEWTDEQVLRWADLFNFEACTVRMFRPKSKLYAKDCYAVFDADTYDVVSLWPDKLSAVADSKIAQYDALTRTEQVLRVADRMQTPTIALMTSLGIRTGMEDCAIRWNNALLAGNVAELAQLQTELFRLASRIKFRLPDTYDREHKIKVVNSIVACNKKIPQYHSDAKIKLANLKIESLPIIG